MPKREIQVFKHRTKHYEKKYLVLNKLYKRAAETSLKMYADIFKKSQHMSQKFKP